MKKTFLLLFIVFANLNAMNTNQKINDIFNKIFKGCQNKLSQDALNSLKKLDRLTHNKEVKEIMHEMTLIIEIDQAPNDPIGTLRTYLNNQNKIPSLCKKSTNKEDLRKLKNFVDKHCANLPSDNYQQMYCYQIFDYAKEIISSTIK